MTVGWIILELQQKEMVQGSQGKEQRNLRNCHYQKNTKKKPLHPPGQTIEMHLIYISKHSFFSLLFKNVFITCKYLTHNYLYSLIRKQCHLDYIKFIVDLINMSVEDKWNRKNVALNCSFPIPSLSDLCSPLPGEQSDFSLKVSETLVCVQKGYTLIELRPLK